MELEAPLVAPAAASAVAVAARAAAAAKAAAQQRTTKVATAKAPAAKLPSVKAPLLRLPEVKLAAGDDLVSRAHKGLAQPVTTQRQHSDALSAPEVFSIAGNDDDDAADTPGSPNQWNTVPLSELDNGNAGLAAEVALSVEEQQQYEEIQAQFERFKSRQTEVERNVADLLARLNTRMHIPSSMASSECGDLTSLASSEWDTESLGATEDGLSILGSRVGSRVGSRAGTPPTLSPLGSPRGGESLTRLQRAAASTALTEKLTGKLNTLKGGVATSSSSQAEAEPDVTKGKPRLTQQLLAAQDNRPQAVSSLCLPSPTPEQPTAGSAPGSSSGPLAAPRDARKVQEAWPPAASRRTAATGSGKAVAHGHAFSSPAGAGYSSPSASQAADQRLPQFGSHGVDADTPGVAGSPQPGAASEDEELRRWQGWTVIATPEGRLFFHNEGRQVSQWHQPQELRTVLGEWEEIVDESQPAQPSFWRNEQLRISLWKDPRQTTNIFQAALDGNLFFMQLYAEVDGQLDVVDPRGRSALHYSCAGGATQSALFLLQRQAEVDRRDDGAATPLIFACRYGYASVVKVLLDARADLQAASDGGNTALHEAAAMGQLDCLHLLLLCGAEAGAANDEGLTAADIATARRHYSCLTLLRRHQPVGASHGQAAARRTPTSSPAAPEAGSPTVPGRCVPQLPAGATEAAAASGARPSSAPTQHVGQQRQLGYAGESSSADSESDLLAEALGPADSGAATSESSDGGQADGQGRTVRAARGRRRERSPVALGLLSRMQVFPRWVNSARRWAFPIQADLGLPNAYVFNAETKQWELPDGEETTRRSLAS